MSQNRGEDEFYIAGCEAFTKYNSDEIEELKQYDCHYVDEAIGRKLDFPKLFDSLATFHVSCRRASYEALPRAEMNNIPFAGDIKEYDEIIIEKKSLETHIEEHINSSFSEKKYIISAKRDYYCVLEFREFSYNIIHVLAIPIINSPYIICDSKFDKLFNFHCDLEISMFSYDRKYGDVVLFGRERSYWIKKFQENIYNEVVKGNDYHLSVLNTNYVPRIEGLQKLKFPETS